MNAKMKKWLIGIITAIICGIIANFIYQKLSGKQNNGDQTNITSNSNITAANGDINIAGGDQKVIKQILNGIDQRDLEKHLKNFKSEDTPGRKKEIADWYDKKRINANMKEALLIVADKIDAELKASRQTIEELKAQGKTDLAELLQKLNKAFEKGIEELEKQETEILDKIKQEKKKTAQKEIEVYLNTAAKYYAALLYDKALKRYKTAFDLQERYFGTNNKRFAFIANQLGFINDTIAEYDKAISWFNKALQIGLKVFAKDHPQIATYYNNLGEAWRAKGEYDKAISLYQKALDIFSKTLPPGHPYIQTVKKNMSGL